MLLIDGVKYYPWTPKNEEKEFHPLVKEHSKEIFGKDSIYFDIKQRLSRSGLRGIPDAYVITLNEPKVWYIVENELSSHDVYEHIVGQIAKFMDLIESLENQRELVKMMCDEIEKDEDLKFFIKKKVNGEYFRFLTELIAEPPVIALIIDAKTNKLEKAIKALNTFGKKVEIIEFKIFVREEATNIKAFEFESLRNNELKLNNINNSSRSDHKINSINQSKHTEYTREGYTGKKISSFVLFNQRYKVNHWNQLLLTVVIELAKKHPDNFDNILSLRGRKRPFFTKNSNELREPQKIEGTAIFVETNLSSNAIVRLTNATMSLFGHNEGIKIEF